MQIEKDLNARIKAFEMEEGRNTLGLTKSLFAYLELDQFDKAIEAVRENSDVYLDFYSTESNYKALNHLVNQYATRKSKKSTTIRRIKKAQSILDYHLKQRGYNVDMPKETIESVKSQVEIAAYQVQDALVGLVDRAIDKMDEFLR